MNKVAQITAYFWIIKICATTLGETAGDLLSMTMNVGYALSSIILISLFLGTLTMQLLSSRFHPVLYWSVILTTSTAGTTMSDYMDRTLELGYAKGSLILVTCLLIVLAIWRFSEKSLSVSNIQTTQAELFYWMAILFSNTLGTTLIVIHNSCSVPLVQRLFGQGDKNHDKLGRRRSTDKLVAVRLKRLGFR
jgi:uncharacterized membrane-anchored protein